MAQVGRRTALTKFGQSLFVKAIQLKCRM